MPDAAAIRFDHIHLRSPDPEATARWFAEMLGAEVIRSAPDGQPRIDLKLGGADIFIAPVPPGDGTVGAPPRPPHQGLDHFGFAVPDLDAAAAALKAKGVEFTLEPKQARPGLRIAFVRGPQGISIELLQRD
jgi:catechol 2,3-dioxygenase-like lactoylglutathione lyase family enzyme